MMLAYIGDDVDEQQPAHPHPDAPITPLGTCSVQNQNGSLYSHLPQTQAVADGIEGGTEMVLGYDAETNTYLASPKWAVSETEDHWASDSLR